MREFFDQLAQSATGVIAKRYGFRTKGPLEQRARLPIELLKLLPFLRIERLGHLRVQRPQGVL